jgi:hypothetical protein
MGAAMKLTTRQRKERLDNITTAIVVSIGLAIVLVITIAANLAQNGAF